MSHKISLLIAGIGRVEPTIFLAHHALQTKLVKTPLFKTIVISNREHFSCCQDYFLASLLILCEKARYRYFIEELFLKKFSD